MESLLSDLSRDELDEDNLSSDVAPIDRSDVGMVVRTLDAATCVRRAGGAALKTRRRNRVLSPQTGAAACKKKTVGPGPSSSFAQKQAQCWVENLSERDGG